MLRLTGADPKCPPVSIQVESPTAGVVLVDAEVDPTDTPLHWRAGLWDKPPLDVVLGADGRLARVQFTLQDEQVPQRDDLFEMLPHRVGWPIFEVASWPESRYLDLIMPVTCVRTDDALVLSIGLIGQISRWIGPESGLAAGIDADAGLIALRFGPLRPDDWDAIDTFSTSG